MEPFIKPVALCKYSAAKERCGRRNIQDVMIEKNEGIELNLAPNLERFPGLIDEYLIVVHPAVLSDGPRLFGDVTTDLGFRLIDGKIFQGGCVMLRYEPLARP